MTTSEVPAAPPADEVDLDAAVYVRGMERLVQAITDLASARTLDEIADIVRHAARELTQADGATFVLRDGGYCFYMEEDAIAPLWRGSRFPLETCISGWAMLNRQGVVIRDIYEDDRIPHDAYRPTFVKSLTMSPIRTADPIGAIGNYWAEEHEATPTERRLLQALADSTAVALESVRTLNELEDRVDERTQQLAAANRDLQRFAAIAAHDLRSPLTSVVGYADLLAKQPFAAEGLAHTAVSGIQKSGARLLELIDELLTFTRAGASDVERSDVDLDELVARSIGELEALINETGAEVSVASLGSVSADRVLLGQVVQNLLVNALTHVDGDRSPVVRVEVARDGDDVHLRVTDNGPGIPADERERVLEPFERGSDSRGRAGTGLGLAICRRVAEHHGGEVVIDDAPGGGAQIDVVLPVART